MGNKALLIPTICTKLCRHSLKVFNFSHFRRVGPWKFGAADGITPLCPPLAKGGNKRGVWLEFYSWSHSFLRHYSWIQLLEVFVRTASFVRLRVLDFCHTFHQEPRRAHEDH